MKHRIVYAGPSSDGRTNKWSLFCDGRGKQYELPTTRFAVDHTDCNICGKGIVIEYNKQVVSDQ